jgi:antitoxin component YwqK of YwqJK toxin-antitoxin module
MNCNYVNDKKYGNCIEYYQCDLADDIGKVWKTYNYNNDKLTREYKEFVEDNNITYIQIYFYKK